MGTAKYGRCRCTADKMPDGTCRHGCPPLSVLKPKKKPRIQPELQRERGFRWDGRASR